MKRIVCGMAAAATAWALATGALAQDRAGLAVGGFYENRTDNEVASEDLTFDYYGVRLSVRDARWFEVFADLGLQSGEWEDYESDGDGVFGLGGTLWLARAEDLMIPLDLGLYGSFHAGECEFEGDSGASVDADYTRWVVQAVIRAAGYDGVRPYLRAGVMRSELDVSGFVEDDDWDATNPAINVGLEIDLGEQLTLALEGNFSEGAGFGIRAGFWF